MHTSHTKETKNLTQKKKQQQQKKPLTITEKGDGIVPFIQALPLIIFTEQST
jgi:hypothetical protein